MKFEQFQQNVQQWAAARGIYEHSTALAQALKAVSEVGELADAVIKNDREALKDAIGDVAVCLVNWAAMAGHSLDEEYAFDCAAPGPHVSLQFCAAQVAESCGRMTEAQACSTPGGEYADGLLLSLVMSAHLADMTFEECCQAAWDEIKDRTGHMVAGGAFVKD